MTSLQITHIVVGLPLFPRHVLSFFSTSLTTHSIVPLGLTVEPNLHRPLPHPPPPARRTRHPHRVGPHGGVEGKGVS